MPTKFDEIYPEKLILTYRLIAQLDADPDISALTTVKKCSYEPDYNQDGHTDRLTIEFNDDVPLASAAETAMNTLVTAHNGSALSHKTISDPLIIADVSSWDPDPSNEALRIRVSTDADGHKILSWKAGMPGKRYQIINTGVKNLKFPNEELTEPATERLITPNHTDYILEKGQSMGAEYDPDDLRWRIGIGI